MSTTYCYPDTYCYQPLSGDNPGQCVGTERISVTSANPVDGKEVSKLPICSKLASFPGSCPKCPSTVCDSQKQFNRSLYKALKYSNKKVNKKMSTVMIISSLIYMVFFFWAVMLAFKQPQQNRVLHIIFAVVFPPVYILAYYMSFLQ